MKKTYILSVVTAFFVFVSLSLYAQDKEEALSKEEQKQLKQEQKRWKKKLKKMSPEKFYEVMTKHKQLKGQSASYDNEIKALEEDVDKKTRGVETMDQSISGLQTRIEKLEANCDENGSSDNDFSSGMLHKVQVGDFNDPTLKAFQEEGDFWEKDQVLDGDTFRKVYTIGYFRDNFKAQAFKKMLRDMGVKDAYVQTYQDGKKATTTE